MQLVEDVGLLRLSMAFGKRAWIDLALHTAFCLADIQIVKAGSGPLWPTVSQKSAAGLAGLEGCDFQSDLPSAPCDVGYRRQLACCLGFLDIRTFALRIPCTAGGKIPGESLGRIVPEDACTNAAF